MIKSYEQFKAATSAIFNSKATSLNQMRSVFAKSLGFDSTQALKQSFDAPNVESTPQQTEISVIVFGEVFSGIVGNIRTYANTPEGKALALQAFKESVELNEYLEDNEIAEALKDEYLSTDKNDYWIKYT